MKQNNGSSRKRGLQFMGLTISLLLLFQLTVMAQDKESPVVGTWERIMNGATMTFILDAEINYTVDFNSDGNIEVYGSYVIEKDTITFNDKPGGYATQEPGIYTFKIEKDKVTFTIKDDPSSGRSGVLAGTWMKSKD